MQSNVRIERRSEMKPGIKFLIEASLISFAVVIIVLAGSYLNFPIQL